MCSGGRRDLLNGCVPYSYLCTFGTFGRRVTGASVILAVFSTDFTT